MTASLAGAARSAAAPDDGFALRHPRLLYSSSELPARRTRMLADPAAAAAYAFIRAQCYDVYTVSPIDSLVDGDAALEPLLNLAVVSHFEPDVDSLLVNLGRRLTLYIARTGSVDTDAFGSSLRLRSMSFGFDHFFVNASAAERDEIRAEVESYLSYMTTNINYDIWRHRPYVSNKTAMVSGALGLAGICFQDELPPALTSAALSKAEEYFSVWRDTHLAGDGCYREGTLYAMWSMRQLIYYFEARERFDGLDHAADPLIRAIENWLPYELDPRGDGRANNIQDQTDYFRPLAWHTTYWAWGQRKWGSGLAAYMWDHSAGPLGRDMLDENDKASTVLWHDNIAPINPVQVLPRSQVWQDRGLYYFRTGWQDGATSDDVVFSFYSGEFRGGHAQEDQNQFTLAAYGEKLIFDQGAGSQAKQSEAHNIIRIDGLGQHNAGSSIGTDGRIVEHVLTGFVDYVRGDATLAYTTHSPYNNSGVPYAWSDWTWGLTGANPVDHAVRSVLTVHGAGAPPYFVIRDDIRKDGVPHQYDWCLHLSNSSVVDTQTDPITVASGNATLRIYPLYPAPAALGISVSAFDNYNEDPNSRLLAMQADTVDPHFTMLLLPLPAGAEAPQVERTLVPGGAGIKLVWESGVVDDIVMRAGLAPGTSPESVDPFPWAVDSDASIAMIRKSGPRVTGYTLMDGSWLTVGAVLVAAVGNGPATMVLDGDHLHLSRPDVQFFVRADQVDAVFYRGTEVPSHVEGEFRVPGYPTGVTGGPSGKLTLRAYPNPFNPSVRVTFVNPSRAEVRATIYDAAGRRVKTLLAQTMDAGEHTLDWDGTDEQSRNAASGVYFLRLHAGGEHATRKLVLLR